MTLRANFEHNLEIRGGRAVLEAAATAASQRVRHFQLTAYSGGFTYLPGMPLPVVFDLSTLRVTDGRPVPALMDHKPDQAVGHTEALQIGPATITGRAVLSASTAFRDQVLESALDGFPWQLSVGVYAERKHIEEIPDGRVVQINQQTLRGPFLLARYGELMEISFTASGADATGAIANLAASFGANRMNFEQYVTSLGLTLSALTAQAVAALRTQWAAAHPQQAAAASGDETPAAPATPAAPQASTPATPPAAPATPARQPSTPSAETPDAGPVEVPTGPVAPQRDPGQEFREQTARDVERVQQLQTLNAQYNPPEYALPDQSRVPLLAHAIRHNWNADQFELQCLRSQRPAAPGVRRTSEAGRVAMLASLVGSVCQRIGVALDGEFWTTPQARINLNASFTRPVNDPTRQQWMEGSDRFRNHSIVDLMIEAAALDGVDLRAAGHYRSGEFMQAAFSSTSIQDLFTQSFTARLMSSYMAAESDLMQLVSETDLPNFLAQERKRIEAGGSRLQRLINQGVAKDMTLSATGETYSASMYANRFQFSEEDALSERFSALQDAGTEMGEASRQLVWDLVANVLMGNPTMSNTRAFFNTTDGNYATGTALTRANMIAGITAFKTQQENGRNLSVRPTDVLVAEANDFVVRELLSPTALITGAAVTQTSQNTLAGQIQNVLTDARLDNGFVDPTSVLANPPTVASLAGSWFLFDRRYPSIEVGYVAGHGRAPRIRRGMLTNGQYGMWIDCSMAVGAAPMRRASARRSDA